MKVLLVQNNNTLNYNIEISLILLIFMNIFKKLVLLLSLTLTKSSSKFIMNIKEAYKHVCNTILTEILQQ